MIPFYISSSELWDCSNAILMTLGMKEPIVLTKTNKENQIIEVTAYHLENLRIVEKFPDVCSLKLVGGKVKNFNDLKKLSLIHI